jgi:hypothetical protein
MSSLVALITTNYEILGSSTKNRCHIYPKKRPIAWIMHSRKKTRRTLNTVQRTPPTTHNKILFVWVINQARNKLAEKVTFFFIISCRFECRRRRWLCQGCTNVPKIKKVPQNSRRYKDDAKQMSHWGPTNIRCYCTKFCCHGGVAARICAPMDSSTRPFMSFLSLNRKVRDRNLKQATTSFFQILFNLSSSIRKLLDDTYYEFLTYKMSVKQTNTDILKKIWTGIFYFLCEKHERTGPYLTSLNENELPLYIKFCITSNYLLEGNLLEGNVCNLYRVDTLW